MSTNSTITVRTAENERKSIYCHWDGYPQFNGNMLMQHYSDYEKAKELVELGDLSSLAPNIHPSTSTHSFDYKEEGVCVFYGRDRGEEGTEPAVLSNAESIDNSEFNYYFDGEKWFCNGKLMELNIEENYIKVGDLKYNGLID